MIGDNDGRIKVSDIPAPERTGNDEYFKMLGGWKTYHVDDEPGCPSECVRAWSSFVCKSSADNDREVCVLTAHY